MEAIFAHPVTCWLAAGVLLIAVEALTAPGIGLFLIGIGAFGAALAVQAEWIAQDAILAQFTCCFAVACISAALLWKPLKAFRLRGKQERQVELNNMLGQTAIVAQGVLASGRPGQVSWSGTLMKAQLIDSDAALTLPEGAQVMIRSVAGTTLHVVPK